MEKAEEGKYGPFIGNVDDEINDLISKEYERQVECIELIASENFTSRAVLNALGSCLTNKYSEGTPGRRYYGGNQFIDSIERICISRALELFDLSSDEWGVNVQPYSGSPANFAAYTGSLKPHDRIMGLDLPSGGHLTHGYQTDKKKVSSTSIYFESMPYQIDPVSGIVDYDQLDKNASLFRPNLIICGGSAYPRDWDYERLRKIADSHHCLLMCDMAHIAGLIAAKEHKNPFEYCDLVTSTTHKTLRGPRSGLIFFRKSKFLHDDINFAVFPGCQGGPHENVIAGVAVAMKEANTDSFRNYIRQVKTNARVLAEELHKLGYRLISGGTDNHLVIWDLRPLGLTGSKVEKALELINITVNKNTVVGDTNAQAPGGIRLGTPAITTRGFKEDHIRTIVQTIHKVIQISLEVQKVTGKKLVDFVPAFENHSEVPALALEMKKLASSFPMPGIPMTDK